MEIILVTGAAASGKSQLAEDICCRDGGKLLYLATMEPAGDSDARIARHRALRQNKGFDTVEQYTDLHRLTIAPGYHCVLLECLGNLVANQMFTAHTPAERVAELVWQGVEQLARQVPRLVVVTNQIFSSWEQYQAEMADYLAALGQLNSVVAENASVVIESVCGLPLMLKGEYQV